LFGVSCFGFWETRFKEIRTKPVAHYRTASYTQATNKRQGCSGMKLVEILARELKAWPEGVKKITQSRVDGELYNAGHSGPDQKALKPRVIIERFHDQKGYPLVTKADWEAERAKIQNAAIELAAHQERAKLKSPKANRDGWIRHSGRSNKSPVDDGVTCTVKFRDGSEATGQVGNLRWLHNGGAADVMRYKIHKPAEQPSPEIKVTHIDHEAGVIHAESASSSCGPVKAEWIEIQESNPLQWRDRIRELDTQRAEVEATYQRQVSEITQERESLVGKLASEGLALVEVVVQPAEDMSDWSKWRKGDIIEFIKTDGNTSSFTLGKHYVFAGVNMRSYNSVSVKEDDDGDYNGWKGKYFKFVSRPAS
jgi:hypothetical protein